MVVVLNATAFALMRLLRIPEPDHRISLYTSNELAIVTDETADSGALGTMQRNLIRNVFALDERTAEELMTPRGSIEAVDLTSPSTDIAHRITASPRSRYPIVDGDLDHVVGMLHVKDFIRAEQRDSSLELQALVRPLPTVAATATAEQVLDRFRRERTHACLVVDEFGGTLGLVTMDDVIAEVMDDEVTDNGASVARHEDGSLSVHGEVTLAELRDDHGIDVDHPDVTTVAGLVLAYHGTVPDIGTTINLPGLVVVVEDVTGRKITRVRLKRVAGVERSS
jgi:CBS domain containing-hemolysin-like protein